MRLFLKQKPTLYFSTSRQGKFSDTKTGVLLFKDSNTTLPKFSEWDDKIKNLTFEKIFFFFSRLRNPQNLILSSKLFSVTNFWR